MGKGIMINWPTWLLWTCSTSTLLWIVLYLVGILYFIEIASKHNNLYGVLLRIVCVVAKVPVVYALWLYWAMTKELMLRLGVW